MRKRDALLTSQQVAERLLCSTESVRRMCEAGRFDGDPSRAIPPASRAGPGARWRIPAAAVDLFAEQARAARVLRDRREVAGASQQAPLSSRQYAVTVGELVPFDPKALTLDVVEQCLGELANQLVIAGDEQGDSVLLDYGVQLLALIDARRSMVDDPDRGALFVDATRAAETHCGRYNRGPRTFVQERDGLLSDISPELADAQAAYVEQGDAAVRVLAAEVARQLAVYPRLRARTLYAKRGDWYGAARSAVFDKIAAAVSKAIRMAKPAELVVTRIMRALGDENADRLFDLDDNARTRRRR